MVCSRLKLLESELEEKITYAPIDFLLQTFVWFVNSPSKRLENTSRMKNQISQDGATIFFKEKRIKNQLL